MKRFLYVFRIVSSICIVITLFISCQKNTFYSANFAFSMPIGVLDGEFQSWGRDFYQYNPSTITMNNNIFFIANGNRIMKFSSNGVLLNTIDNAVLNNDIGNITLLAVDSNERIIFANALSSDDVSSYVPINDMEQALSQLFAYSVDGNTLHIGREGQKNYDFFSILAIDILIEDTIAIFSSEKNGKVMYVFNNNGRLENRTYFSSSLYPKYPLAINASDQYIYGVINKVVASFNVDALLVQVDYYTYEKESNSEVTTSIDFFDSLIYTLDLQTGEYTDYIKLSFSPTESLELQFADEKSRLVFFSYGVGEDATLSNNAPNVLVFDKKGNIENIIIPVLPDIEFVFAEYNISKDGFLSALFLEENQASVYWWKTSISQ